MNNTSKQDVSVKQYCDTSIMHNNKGKLKAQLKSKWSLRNSTLMADRSCLTLFGICSWEVLCR